MADAEQIDLIDFSSENDNLIFNLSSPPPDGNQKSSENHTPLKKFNMLGDVDAGKCVSQENDHCAPVPELVESEEPQGTRRNGKFNLRKSLAWDSAFFTSAGVLNPEELSSIMKGAKKADKPLLPGIQEDIRVSSDSISTLESDNFTLESVEVELFEDIRASIQKSCKAVKNSGSTTGFEVASNKAISSPNVSLNSANRPKPDMKKPTGLKITGMPKCPPKMSTKMQVSGRAIKPGPACPQVPKSALRVRESTSSVPKPPKEINSTIAATTKRASLSANRSKPDNDNAKSVADRGTQVLKAPITSGARRVLPKPSISSRFSSLGPPTVTKTQPSRSSKNDDSGSTTSSNGGKSPSATVGRKVAAKMLHPPSSNSAVKTPSRSALRSKSTSKNSSLSAYLTSSKISSNISPASSISEWSSASSSTSSVYQRSNKSRTSIGSSSSRSVEIDTPSLDMKTRSEKLSNGQENRRIVLPDQNMRKSSQTGTLSRSASMKPSGLKMPSPKIGFFDGVKSVHTPNGTSQLHSGLPMVLSKTGAGTGSKVGKLPAGRESTAVAILKPEKGKPNPPSPSKQKAEAATDLDVRDEKDVKSYLKPDKVGGDECEEAKSEIGVDFGASLDQNLGVLKNEISLDKSGDPCLTDVKLVGAEGECYVLNTNSSPNLSASGRLDSVGVDSQRPISNQNSCCKITEKENVKVGVDCQNVEPVKNFGPVSIINSEFSARSPLAIMNSLCHNASVELSQVPAEKILEKAVDLPDFEGEQKEIPNQHIHAASC